MRPYHSIVLRRGFTLMEVLLVLAILLVIMGLVVPRLTDRQREAKVEATKVSIEGLSQAIKLYALDHDGEPPRTTDGIQILLEPNKSDKDWKGPTSRNPLSMHGDSLSTIAIQDNAIPGPTTLPPPALTRCSVLAMTSETESRWSLTQTFPHSSLTDFVR